jgi:hypothetical protein
MTQVNTKNTNTMLLSLVVALGLVLVAWLIIIPAIHEAQAITSSALDRIKGQRGEDSSGGKRNGHGGFNI